MSVSGISASQLTEIQAAYAAFVPYASEVSTPDGSVKLVANGSLLQAKDPDGQEIYRYFDTTGLLMCPAITQDGSTGYSERKTFLPDWAPHYSIVKVPIHGIFKRPRHVVDTDECQALTVDAKGTALAVAVGGEIRTLELGQSRWAQRIFGHTTSMEKVGSIPEPVAGLQYLKDGGLLVLPYEFLHRCYIVRAGVPGATRVPLRDLSPAAYRDRILNGFPFLNVCDTERVDRFVAQAGGLVDDEGNASEVRWERNPLDPRQVVMFATEGNERGTLWTWNDGSLTKIATLPASAPPPPVQTWLLPGSDIKSRVRMDWTSDGQRVVLAYHLLNQTRIAVHVVGLDGRCISFPPVDKMEFIPRPYPLREGSDAKDKLCVTIGNETHEIAIPDDLDTLDWQDWYLRALRNAVFGDQPSRKPQDLHVERGDGSLVIGGISVPIRKPEGP